MEFRSRKVMKTVIAQMVIKVPLRLTTLYSDNALNIISIDLKDRMYECNYEQNAQLANSDIFHVFLQHVYLTCEAIFRKCFTSLMRL